jgi:hypothetical protein
MQLTMQLLCIAFYALLGRVAVRDAFWLIGSLFQWFFSCVIIPLGRAASGYPNNGLRSSLARPSSMCSNLEIRRSSRRIPPTALVFNRQRLPSLWLTTKLLPARQQVLLSY